MIGNDTENWFVGVCVSFRCIFVLYLCRYETVLSVFKKCDSWVTCSVMCVITCSISVAGL
jgi:hypothetical protein